MSDKLNKIKARIKALSERTVDRGCTEAEATAAAALMGKLLEEYSLTMSEVDVRSAKCRTLSIVTSHKARPAVHGVVGAIASFTDCKVWFTASPTITYRFFGQESDLQAAEYLFRLIDRATDTAAAHFRTTSAYALSYSRRDATRSFKLAMVSRLVERLRQMKAERDAAVARAAGQGTALVVLKNQVVASEFAALGMRTKPDRYAPAARSREAVEAGRAAGDRVNLSRPVDGGASHLRLS